MTTVAHPTPADASGLLPSEAPLQLIDKDGRPGGSIEHVVLADGRQIGTGDAIPGALTVPGVQ